MELLHRNLLEATFRCMKRDVVVFAVLVTAIVCGVSASQKGQTEKTQIVASVGNRQITLQDFSDRYEDYLIFTGLQDNLQARFAILNNMINEILLRQYDDNSKVYGNVEYKKEIASARNRAILAFLKDREVYAKITVTERELREAYQRSKIKLAVRHLYAPTEKEAEDLYNLATIGVSFDELARQVFSDTALRKNGGYLGYLGWGDTDPNFESAAYSLKVGEISRPVKTSQGYSIIRVDDRIEDPFATENGFLNQKHKLERALRIDKKKGSEEAYLQKVFDKRRVRFNEKALNAVLNNLKNSKSGDIESDTRTPQVFAYCVEYKGRKYGQKEIERRIHETPEYDRSLLRDAKLLKEAVTGLIMQDVLLEIAKAKGYDTTSYVNETFTKLANDVYLNYKRNEVLDLVPVADSEVTEYYRKNISYHTSEREMNVQEIIVDSDSLAAAIRARIDRGEDFGTLAVNYSLRKWSAKNKGVLGLSPISHFGNMKDTLWNLAAGKFLGPVKFDKYYGIFQVLGRKNGQPIGIDVLRNQIVKAIKNEKGFPYMKQRLARLSKEMTIKVDDDAIKSYTMNVAGK